MCFACCVRNITAVSFHLRRAVQASKDVQQARMAIMLNDCWRQICIRGVKFFVSLQEEIALARQDLTVDIRYQWKCTGDYDISQLSHCDMRQIIQGGEDRQSKFYSMRELLRAAAHLLSSPD